MMIKVGTISDWISSKPLRAMRGLALQPFYLDDMMRHLERNYYVVLMSAGSFYF